MIDIIGKKHIQRRIIEEIIEASVHFISADEVTTSDDEILSICLRYVNNDNEICEVFGVCRIGKNNWRSNWECRC